MEIARSEDVWKRGEKIGNRCAGRERSRELIALDLARERREFAGRRSGWIQRANLHRCERAVRRLIQLDMRRRLPNRRASE